MAYDKEGMPIDSFHVVSPSHYHGGPVRALFLANAILLLVAESVGAKLPFSETGVILLSIILIIAAGITNPTQAWIHWANAVLAIFGVLIFGINAIDQYRAGAQLLEPGFFCVELLALLFMIALYYATKTTRGILLRRKGALV